MRERVCKNCGGREYKVVGQNMVKCAFCGTLYVDEHASKEEEVLLVGARELARAFRFDEAVEEFDKILSLFPLSFEAHFGKCLAKNKIILYASKKGTSERPRFFSCIVSILEDEDFKQAMKLAPQETAALYEKIAKRIERIKKTYDDECCKQSYDLIMCTTNLDKDSPEDKIAQTYENLKKSGKNVYFLQDLTQKEREEDTFRALETSKCFLFFAQSKSGYSEFKHLLDRWQNFVTQRKKPKTSFILAIDEWTIRKENLPREFAFCKNVIDTNSISFLQDIEVLVQNEIENFVGQTAKIDTIKIKKVQPKKKEYVDVESVDPIELGHYDVENVNLSEQTKIKWIFLSLKNGDFDGAQELATAELEKDPYSSELLFASLMAQKQIKTPEEFFSSISNFSDKEKIDNVLHYASKDFATDFVDKWEKLIESLDDEEYFCAFLIYLASFQTPNRESFVATAEQKAIETLNEDLIEKVQQCFDKEDVNRFVEFYYALAQKSDDDKYYQKIVELDEGHIQSNMALFLRHFKTVEDKLSYRNKEEFENVLAFFDEHQRVRLISSIVSMVMSVAFFDLAKTEEQLDFYLSYINSPQSLCEISKNIALQFQEMRFFKQAEKYLSIAISKDKGDGTLYWSLILVKAHCRNENELILTDVKVTQMPEWETLLEVSDDQHDEMYAEIVSKGNLYKGKKMPIQPSLKDKVQLKEKLEAFLLRNEKILLEIEKQEGTQSGVNYFRSQLVPFEKYITDINTQTFEEYCTLVKKIEERFVALDLTLDSSVSVSQLLKRVGQAQIDASSLKEEKRKIPLSSEKTTKDQRKNKFWKRFLCIFLEFYPLLFSTFLLTITIIMPKEVYLYFSQDFLICTLIYSVVVAMGNLAWWIIRKQKSSKQWKAVFWILFAIGAINLVLFGTSFYFTPKPIELSSNANELQVLLSNAKYADFVMTEDVNFEGKVFKSSDFYGNFDGNGHSISNIRFSKDGLFKNNSGSVKNLTLNLAELDVRDVGTFGAVASTNSGEISSCVVSGTINIHTNIDLVLGGIVGRNNSGSITNCDVKNLVVTIWAQTQQVKVGGLVGVAKRFENAEISQNAVNVNIEVLGTVTNLFAGGLVGQGEQSSHDNYAVGKIVSTGATGGGFVGGLYGRYSNSTLTEEILHSYANVEIETNFEAGTLVGHLGGMMNSCFSTQVGDLTKKENILAYCDPRNCEGESIYDSKFQFDPQIWDLSSDLPRFLREG